MTSAISATDRDVLNQIAECHSPEEGGGMGYRTVEGVWSYGHMDPVCRSCGTPDEYAVEWPCATRRLLDMLTLAVPA
jgi:hypothetical protein